MKRAFRYIENIWLGDDGKPSGKRVSALALTVQMVYSILSHLNAYAALLRAALLKPTDIGADKIAAAGATLSSFAMVLAVEAGIIAALWGIAGYQSVKFNNGGA